MKQLMTLRKFFMLGIFLFTGIFSSIGQISDDPTNRNLTIDSKVLYEHGYNKDNFTTTPDSPREDVDSVMVTSVMNYFVMPDIFWNGAYFLQNDYQATNLTVSEFDWAVTLGAVAAQNPNTTGTSPWVKITWGITPGTASIVVKEIPQSSSGATCDGLPTTIPVLVIPKPTIGFNQAGTPPAYFDSDCYTISNVASAFYDFPITVTTSSNEVLINYSVQKTDLNTGIVTTTSVSNIPVGAGTGVFRVLFSDFGAYKVTITSITDRIARKCDVLGDINSGANEFTFNVLPAPQQGSVYHIPNNF